jgi:hypothetical protein
VCNGVFFEGMRDGSFQLTANTYALLNAEEVEGGLDKLMLSPPTYLKAIRN